MSVAKRESNNHQAQAGFTLLELLLVIALFGILCTVAISNLRILENPLVSTSANLTHYFRLVRARAISQTRSIKVHAENGRSLVAESASTCDADTFTAVSDLTLEINDKVSFDTTDWTVCFTQRGLAADTVNFTIRSEVGLRQVEIALGGGVHIE